MLALTIAGLFIGGMLFLFLWWTEMREGNDVFAIIAGMFGMTMISCGSIMVLAILGGI